MVPLLTPGREVAVNVEGSTVPDPVEMNTVRVPVQLICITDIDRMIACRKVIEGIRWSKCTSVYLVSIRSCAVRWCNGGGSVGGSSAGHRWW